MNFIGRYHRSIKAIVFIIFYSAASYGAQRDVSQKYSIYSGSGNAVTKTFVIDPINLAPNEVVVIKSCRIFASGLFTANGVEQPSVYANTPIDVWLGLSASVRFTDENGNSPSRACSVNFNKYHREKHVVPSYPHKASFSVSGFIEESHFYGGGYDSQPYILKAIAAAGPYISSVNSSEGHVIYNNITGSIDVGFELIHTVYREDEIDIDMDDVLSLAQVVYDPDFSDNIIANPSIPDNTIDLVENKATDILVSGVAMGFEPNEVFPVSVILEDLDTNQRNVLTSAIISVKEEGRFREFVPLPNITEGNYRIYVEADPDDTIEEETEDNNIGFTKEIKVHRTHPLDIGLIEISCSESDCFQPPVSGAAQELASAENTSFLNNLLPLAPENLSLEVLPFELDGSVDQTPTYLGEFPVTLGLLDDMRVLENLAWVNNKRKLIAAVDSSYFKYHFPEEPPMGYALVEKNGYSGKIGMVINDPFIFYHELGHLLGGEHIQPTITTDGYDNLSNTEIKNYTPIMSEFLIPKADKGFWISKRTYSSALYYLSQQQVDPEVLIVSGILNRETNHLIKSEVSYSPQGTLTVNNPEGALEIQAIDKNNNVLSSIKISIDKQLVVHYVNEGQVETEAVNMDIVPYSAALAYSPDISKVVLLKSGVLVEEVPVSRSFADIVKDLNHTDFEYRFNIFSKIKRKFLVKIARGIDLAIKRGKLRRAKYQFHLLMKIIRYSKIKSEAKVILIKKLKAQRQLSGF